MALDKELIGKNIREIREKVLKDKRITLAMEISLSEVQLGRIERGETLASIEIIEQVARLGGVSIDDITHGKDISNKYGIDMRLAMMIRHASAEEKELYLELLTTINKSRFKKSS